MVQVVIFCILMPFVYTTAYTGLTPPFGVFLNNNLSIKKQKKENNFRPEYWTQPHVLEKVFFLLSQLMI